MNSLTWLIYFGDITTGLTALLGIFGFMFVFGGIVGAVISVVENHNKIITRVGIGAAFVGFLFLFTSAMLPTKDGVYMIASAQMNEDIIKNPKTDITNKTYNVINKYLDNQLAEKNR